MGATFAVGRDFVWLVFDTNRRWWVCFAAGRVFCFLEGLYVTQISAVDLSVVAGRVANMIA